MSYKPSQSIYSSQAESQYHSIPVTQSVSQAHSSPVSHLVTRQDQILSRSSPVQSDSIVYSIRSVYKAKSNA